MTGFIKERLGLDFSLANELEFINGKASGEVKLPSFFFRHENSLCSHSICKSHALSHIANHYQINIQNCIAVGDSLPDLCMIEKSGIGIAFRPSSNIISYKADKVIKEKSMIQLMEFAK